jgi:hypothetical protein
MNLPLLKIKPKGNGYYDVTLDGKTVIGRRVEVILSARPDGGVLAEATISMYVAIDVEGIPVSLTAPEEATGDRDTG